MKKLRKLGLFFCMALIPILSACSGGGSSGGGSGGNTTSAAAQGITFSIAKSALVAAKATGKSVAAETLDPAAKYAAVIVKDSSGATVLDMYKTDIYSLNGSYITATIPLTPANYQLAGFFILDANNKVLYSVPTQLATAEIKAMVTTVLPINFGVTKDVTNTISLQVLAIGEATANDFGYPSIIFDVVVPGGVKFMTDVQILDVPGRNWLQIDASLKVNNVDYTVNAVTTTLRVPEAASFTLVYSKPGYASKTITLTAAEMANYRSYPLVVILTPSLTPSVLESSAFENIWGIAVDRTGSVYVSDIQSHTVRKFSSTGALITQWGSYGSGDGEFNTPLGIATDLSENVYVVDSVNNRIQKFSSTGAFITQWGSAGPGDGQFNYPGAIAVGQSGDVYVADYGNQRIQKFSSTGVFITQWGSGGAGNGQFMNLYYLALDQFENVYAADGTNHRVQKFDSTGAYITQWGGYGSGDGQFNTPYSIAVDQSGNVYVLDYGNNRIQKFSSTGVFITSWGNAGTGNEQWSSDLRGVAVDQLGNIYVVDTGNRRVQVFRP